MKNNIQKAYFAGGCFWGVEYYFEGVEGVISTRVGYMGGRTPNPTYKDVSAGDTGYAETMEVIFDADKVSFENLAKLFFEIHDPTEVNRQGPDIGEQYRSAIFYTDDEQRKTIERLIAQLKAKGIDAVTELTSAESFYAAEEYHQKYYDKSGGSPYCHMRRKIF